MADGVVTKEVRTKLTADARELDAAMAREAREAERMARELRRYQREHRRFQQARGHMSAQEERDIKRMIVLSKTRRREEAAAARRELVQRQRLERAAEAQRREEERINRALRRRRAILRGLGGAGRFLMPGPGMGALLAGGAVAGAGYGIAKLVGSAAQRQQDRLGLATTVADAERMSGKRIEWSTAKTMADALTASFRESAKTLPGSYEDVQLAFRDIAEFARAGAGASFKDIAELSAAISARQSFSGLQAGTVSRDVRQLLGGQFRENEIQTSVLRFEGKRIAEMVKSGAAEEAFKEITRLLQLTREQREDYGNSFGGALETLKDQIKELMVIAGTPAMTWLTDKFKEWTAYITENQDDVEKWIKSFGEDLVEALKSAESALKGFAAVIKWIADRFGDLKALGDAFEDAGSKPMGGLMDAWAANLGYDGMPRSEWGDEHWRRWAKGDVGLLDAFGRPARGLQIGTPWQLRGKAKSVADLLGDPAIPNSNLRNPKVNVDARGSRITIQQRIETDDPERIAGASLGAAFGAVVSRPLTGTFGLGSLALSVGD